MKKKRDKRVVIVILNYLNYTETDACIQSVLGQAYDNFHILVVDNGSDNESYRFLRKKYSNHKLVSVIKAGRNYGFAKGNNIGIHYAREKLHAEYVMLLNSDTLMEDAEYLYKMVESDADGIGVIGSGIIQKDNAKVKKIYRYVTFPGTLFYYLESVADYWGYSQIHDFWNGIRMKYEGSYMIQGCILLLTPAYFLYYNDLDPRTFLYCEEELLYLRCQRAGLEQKVNDHINLYHKYGQSSKLLYGNTKKVFLKYMLSSYKFVLWESIQMFLESLVKKEKHTRGI